MERVGKTVRTRFLLGKKALKKCAFKTGFPFVLFVASVVFPASALGGAPEVTFALSSGVCEPGGETQLSLLISNTEPVQAFSCAFGFKRDVVRLYYIAQEGTASADADYFEYASSESEGGGRTWVALGVVFDLGESPVEKVLEPGTEQEVAKVTMNARPNAPEGLYPVDFEDYVIVSALPVRNIATIDAGDVYPVLEGGEIEIKVVRPPRPVELECIRVRRSEVFLRWKNEAAYDEIKVLLEGEVIDAIGGDATEYTYVEEGMEVPGEGYQVRGVVAGTESPLSELSSLVQVPFIRGDANSDGMVNVADPVFVLCYLYLPSACPDVDVNCYDALDANDDGKVVNNGDPVYLLNYLFALGPPPPVPFPACAVDPTADVDKLGCKYYPGCE